MRCFFKLCIIIMTCFLLGCQSNTVVQLPFEESADNEEIIPMVTSSNPVSFLVSEGSTLDADIKARIEADVIKMAELVPLSDIKISIVDNKKTEYSNGILFFTKEEVLDNSFRSKILSRFTDLNFWKKTGLEEYIYGYEPVHSEEEVREYIIGSGSKALAAMFPLCFISDYADEKTTVMVGDYAYYVTKYILENYTYDDFTRNEYRGEWINGAGADYPFVNDDIDAIVQTSAVSKETAYYKLVCNGNTWELRSVDWLKTADQVYSLLYKCEEGIRDFTKRIAAQSEQYDEDYFKTSVTITVLESGGNSSAGNYHIYLSNAESFLHEYVHCVLAYSASEVWISEGLAVYYGLEFSCGFRTWAEHLRRIFDLGQFSEDEKKKYEEEGILEYAETTVVSYQKMRRETDTDNECLFCMEMAKGISDLIYFGTETAENVGSYTVSQADLGVIKNDRLCNRLSYNAAMILVGALIDEYGIDAFINSQKSFEKDFGISSDDYLTDYLQKKEYLSLLGEKNDGND